MAINFITDPRGVLYDKDVGYSVTREVIEAAAVGVIHATQKACPVFGASAYSVGEEWQQGPCTRCRCVDTNRDECVREVCPPPACEYFTFEADKCCPVCQDRKEYLEMVERARNPDPPVIVKKPRNMTALVGDTLTIDCTGWGDPKPQITLVRNQPEEYVHFHLEPETSSKPGDHGQHRCELQYGAVRGSPTTILGIVALNNHSFFLPSDCHFGQFRNFYGVYRIVQGLKMK
eukprot:sb/3469381/